MTHSKPEDLANCLNDHFIDKVQTMVKSMPVPKVDILTQLKNTPTPSGDQMKLMSFTAEELNNNIRKMKKNAASGSDSLYIR